jgi:hypothetical protein
MVSTRNS